MRAAAVAKSTLRGFNYPCNWPITLRVAVVAENQSLFRHRHHVRRTPALPTYRRFPEGLFTQKQIVRSGKWILPSFAPPQCSEAARSNATRIVSQEPVPE